MRETCRRLKFPYALLIVLVLLSVSAAVAAPPVTEVKVGTDCWTTEDPTDETIATIPHDFFCPGSPVMTKVNIAFKGKPLIPQVVKEKCGCAVDTKIIWKDRHGNAITDPNRTRHAVSSGTVETTNVDTCVRRTTTAKFTKNNEIVKVDLQLIALSLQSKEALKVTCGDGSTKTFTVFVTQSAKQPSGSQMTFTPKSLAAKEAHGEVQLKSLNIRYDVEFRPRTGTSLWMRNRPLKLVDTVGTFDALFP